MRKWTLGAGLLALALAVQGEQKKEPFYRAYLVPGNPLDERIREQEKRVEEDPHSAALRNDFGNLLAARGFAGDARKQYHEAMRLDAKNFLAAYNLGLLEEKEGRTSAAISAFKESIHRKKGFPPSRFHLGHLYEKTGSTDAAIEEYAVALRIDPSMRDPRRNPLAADSSLLYRVSLTNYERDLAAASAVSQTRWADENRFSRTPADRALAAEDVSEGPATAPTPVPASPGPSVVRAAPVAAPPPTPLVYRPVPPPGVAPFAPGFEPTPTPAPRAPPPVFMPPPPPPPPTPGS